MFGKGLIFRMKKGDSAKYGAVPFVVGSFEYQLKDLDREFADLFDQYFSEAFGKGRETSCLLFGPYPSINLLTFPGP